MTTQTLGRFIRRVVGNGRQVRTIEFSHAGREYECLVPEDSLWGAVKDNLILSEYERANVQINSLRRVVVDAGAHVGLFSLRIAPFTQQVVALEPHPRNFSMLKQNLERNGVTNVEALRLALWTSADRLDLTEGSDSGGSSLTEAGLGHYRTSTTTLRDLLNWYGHVDLLKLDIEGAEFPVLLEAEDSVVREIDTIVVELHVSGREGKADLLSQRLTGLGFKTDVLGPPLMSWSDGVPRIIRTWRSIKGLKKLKLASLGVYAVVPLAPSSIRRRFIEAGKLAFLYGVQGVVAPNRPAEDSRQ